MLKGVRVAIKYFTVGLLAGLLLAPRKGDDTRAILIERAREYFQELIGGARDVADEVEEKVDDISRGTHETDHRSYDGMATGGVQ